MGILICLAILWLISPIVLLVLLITAQSDKKRLNEELKRQNEYIAQIEMWHSLGTPAYSQKNFNTINNVNMPTNIQQDVNITPTQAVPINISQNAFDENQPIQTTSTHQNASAVNEQENPYGVSLQKNKNEKPGVSTINIMLIIGALFIITSGLIFATTTWDIMSNGIRAAVLFSFSAIFFATSSLAERKFNLPKTGLLFYTLGSFFLPITLIAAGYFNVFGDWFSLSGEGCPLLISITFVALSAVSFKGALDYKNKAFSWCSLLSFSAAVCAVAIQINSRTDVVSLILSIYGFAVILICGWLSKSSSERFSIIISQLKLFAIVNVSVLSISSIIGCFDGGRNQAVSMISCTLFAVSYLHNCFTEKSGFGGALPFTAFISAGLFSLISPDSFNSFSYIVIGISLIVSAFSLMNIVPEKLKSAFSMISNILQISAVCICAMCIFTSDTTWITFAAYSVLASDMLLLAKLNKEKSKLLLSSFSVTCVVLTYLFVSLLFKNSSPAMVCCAMATIILLLQTLFVFVKPLKIRTIMSDITFSVVSVIIELIVLSFVCSMENVSGVDFAYLAYACTALIITLLIPAISKSERRFPEFYVGFAAFFFCSFALPLYELIKIIFVNASSDVAVTTSVGLCSLALAAFSICSTLAYQKKNDSIIRKNIDLALVIAFRSALVILVIAEFICDTNGLLSDSFQFGANTAIPLLALIAVSAVRSAVLKSKAEYVTTLLSITTFITSCSMIIFRDLSFKWILIFTCGAAFAIFAVNELVLHISKKNPIFYLLTLKVSGYMLAILSACTMIAYNGSNYENKYLLAIALVFIASTFVNYINRCTLILIPQFIMLYIIIPNIPEISQSNAIIGLLYMFVILFTIALSYLLHPNKLINSVDKKDIYADIMAYTRFFGCAAMFIVLFDDDLRWLVLPALSTSFASMYRRENKLSTNSTMFTLSAAGIVLAWITQPFFAVPNVIVTELNLVSILLFMYALTFIWKDNKATVYRITFITYCISYVILLISALASDLLADGLIIVISALAMLIYSFTVKRKKWFLLSVIVIVVSTVFLSRKFWANAGWWVYLLIAGLILIALGILNELKKQSAEKSKFSEKVSRFMSEWTW